MPVGRARPRRSRAVAILAAVAAAIVGSMMWALIASLLRLELSAIAILIGLTVGAVIVRTRPADCSLAIVSAVVSVAGCAFGVLSAEVILALRDRIPAGALSSRFGEILHAYPATVGWLGVLLWLMAGCAGFLVPGWTARKSRLR
jgi:hypothetical protein